MILFVKNLNITVVHETWTQFILKSAGSFKQLLK